MIISPEKNIFSHDRAALAPLAGITNSVFRRICASFGARPVMTEMVSADGLVRGKPGDKTSRLLSFNESERPIGFQLFGSDPAIMAEAVGKALELKPDFIDINAGCPAKKVVTKGSGSALLLNLDLLERIVGHVAEASSVPVTVKIRSGWDNTGINAVEAACVCADAGAGAIILHPRTRSQKFSGAADWSIIRAVKETVSVPVIGSGDIISPDGAAAMIEQTGADAVMIGRQAMGNPWIFKQVAERLRGDEVSETPDIAVRLNLALRQLEITAEETSERFAVLNMRKFFGWYSRRMRGGAVFRQQVFRAMTIAEVTDVVRAFHANFENYEQIEDINHEVVGL